MDNKDVQATSEVVEDEHSRIYWMCYNIKNSLLKFYERHRKLFIALMILIVLSIIGLRAEFHPLVMVMRRYFGVVVIGLPIVLGIWLFVRHRPWKIKIFTALVVTIVMTPIVLWGKQAHTYMSLYYEYSTLDIVDLEELPISNYERIQPLNSIYSLAHEVMIESESPTMPNYVRIGDEYRWTMAIEPAYPLNRIFGEVDELFNIPGTSPSPNFSRDNRVQVDFQVGENLKFSRNTRVAVIKRFGPWRYFNYEPSDITYVTDDDGNWIQVVSLIHWKGIIFPRPEFGGVAVIRQNDTGILAAPKLLLIGAGEMIPPESIADHQYLTGQNILPYEVSRYIANSFRFQNGFLSPMPGYHRGDIRIPDLPADVNEQPFSAYFEMDHGDGSKGMLYHYFALEPFDPDKQGLNTSLFIPSDGSGSIYVYRHYERSGSLTGVSAISSKVMESKKNYDWSTNYPVEHRPFIRNVGGQIRFFWLTTIVTRKEGEGSHFIAGNIPELVITDANYNNPVWVDSKNPGTWIDALTSANEGVWSSK